MSKLPSYLSSMLKMERVAVAKEFSSKQKQIRSTGSVSFDWAVGGGIPVGELVMLWGSPGSGKSLMALKLLAQEQKMNPNKYGIFIDTEYAFNPERAASLGVDLDRLVVIQSNTFEGAIKPLAKMEDEIKKNKDCCAIILDSVKALTALGEQGAMEEGDVSGAANGYGGISKSINPALNVLNRIANECEVLVVLTNHAMANLDTRMAKYYPWVLTGGQRLKHLCSTIIFLEKASGMKDKLVSESKDGQGKNIAVGSKVRCKVNKTRLTVEGKAAEFWLNMETGDLANQYEELVELALNLGVLYKKETGNTIFFGPEELGIKAGNMSKFVDLVKMDENLYAKIKQEVFTSKNMGIALNADIYEG